MPGCQPRFEPIFGPRRSQSRSRMLDDLKSGVRRWACRAPLCNTGPANLKGVACASNLGAVQIARGLHLRVLGPHSGNRPFTAPDLDPKPNQPLGGSYRDRGIAWFEHSIAGDVSWSDPNSFFAVVYPPRSWNSSVFVVDPLFFSCSSNPIFWATPGCVLQSRPKRHDFSSR